MTLNSGDGDSNRAAHLADRGKAIKHGRKGENIAGYDSDLMAGRSLLSKEEEKRLLRRVDLRLMPLLALILMVKNLDANNVSCSLAHNSTHTNDGVEGCKRPNYESRHAREYLDAAQHEQRRLQLC